MRTKFIIGSAFLLCFAFSPITNSVVAQINMVIAEDTFTQDDGPLLVDGGTGFGGNYVGATDDYEVLDGQAIGTDAIFRLLPDTLANLGAEMGTDVFYLSWDYQLNVPDNTPAGFAGFSLFDSDSNDDPSDGAQVDEIALLGQLSGSGVWRISTPGGAIPDAPNTDISILEFRTAVARLDIETNTIDLFLGENATDPVDLSGEPASTLTLDVPQFIVGNIDQFRMQNNANGGQFANYDNIQFGLITDSDVLLGDVNGDGVVDLVDIAPFVDLILNGGFQEEADLNGDGVVDLVDIAPFVALILGG